MRDGRLALVDYMKALAAYIYFAPVAAEPSWTVFIRGASPLWGYTERDDCLIIRIERLAKMTIGRGRLLMAAQMMNVSVNVNTRLLVEQFDFFSKKVADPPRERFTRKMEADLEAVERFISEVDDYVDYITDGWPTFEDETRLHFLEVARRNIVSAEARQGEPTQPLPRLSVADFVWWLFNKHRVHRALSEVQEALLDISDAILSANESTQGWYRDLLEERLREAGACAGAQTGSGSRGEIMSGGQQQVQG